MKIKSKNTSVFSLLFAGTLIFMMCACTVTLGDLPSITIKKSDQTKTNLQEYFKGKTSILIHFDADCKGCQDEAQMIIDNLDQFKNMRIAFVSIQEFDKINLFDEYFELSQKRNIIVGQDYSYAIPNQFKTYSTPLLVLIDEDSQIRKVAEGEIKIDKLSQFINEIK